MRGKRKRQRKREKKIEGGEVGNGRLTGERKVKGVEKRKGEGREIHKKKGRPKRNREQRGTSLTPFPNSSLSFYSLNSSFPTLMPLFFPFSL